MITSNRREFLQGSLGTTAAVAASILPGGAASAQAGAKPVPRNRSEAA